MKVKDVMTKYVVSLSTDDTVERAVQLMKEHNIGSVPVCSGDKVVGIITDRDIAIRSTTGTQNFTTQSVREVMSSNPVWGTPDMDIQDVSKVMSDRQIRRLPIMDGNNLVGMVSLGDIAVQPKLQHQAEQALSGISEFSTPQI